MAELEALQSKLKQFEECGASLIALCPQRQGFNSATAEDLGLGFPVVQDRDNQIASAFGLTLQTPPNVIEAEKFLGLDLPKQNGTDNWDLPMPARYAIDRQGRVLFASVHADHRLRSDPQDCLDVLRSINSD